MFRLKRVLCCVNCVLKIIIRIQHLATRMGYSSDVLLSSWRFWKLRSSSVCFSYPYTWLLALLFFVRPPLWFHCWLVLLESSILLQRLLLLIMNDSISILLQIELAFTLLRLPRLLKTISVIGKKTYGTLRDLSSPENTKDKTFEQLCELLERHFQPKRLEIAESYQFHHRFQEENETVSVYSAHLQHLASSCNF